MTSGAVPPIGPPTITCLLVKVASRCNLSCDYCYMYEHADQSWRFQPRVIAPDTVDLLASRVREHVVALHLGRLSVVLHGGEPLLVGADKLVQIARRLRGAASPSVLDIGIQTNGVLLDDEAIELLSAERIAVSLSLDGPSEVHDRHRPTKGGTGSHRLAMAALTRLQRHPEVYSGLIGVIDADSDPAEIVRWFAGLRPPALDLLLPDATHDSPPIGRDQDADRYERWLLDAFDTWYDEFPHLPLRTFDAMIAAVTGVPSGTDAFGLGQVSLLTIETDGSYHDLDVLKTTYEGRTGLGIGLTDASIQQASRAPKILEHDRLLRVDGLGAQCRSCPEVSVCGGGAVPHRYRAGGPGGGFGNPSIYCKELFALITHVRARVAKTLEREAAHRVTRATADVLDWEEVDGTDRAMDSLGRVLVEWREESRRSLLEYVADQVRDRSDEVLVRFMAADVERQASAATRASAQLWLRAQTAAAANNPLHDLDGCVLEASAAGLLNITGLGNLDKAVQPALHREEPLLRLPFGHPIVFLPADDERLPEHRQGLRRALDVIQRYSPGLRREISALCSDVQLVRDVEAHPDKVVSFSDDTVPGALYVSTPNTWTVEAVHDVADSIIHEHRHQKLYLVGRAADLLLADFPLIQSPWRDDPRPPSGVLHAVFVFVELLDFWRWVSDRGPAELNGRAKRDVETILGRLHDGLRALDGCRLTPAGVALTRRLADRVGR